MRRGVLRRKLVSMATVGRAAMRRFHIWAVRTIDDGIELLTGRRAGRRRADGSFPPESVHGLVAARLADYAERLRAFSEPVAEPVRDGRPKR